MSDQTPEEDHGSRPRTRARIRMAAKVRWVDWKKHFWMVVGIGLFCALYFCPPLPDLTDPKGELVVLTHEGKAALGLFLLGLRLLRLGLRLFPLGLFQLGLLRLGLRLLKFPVLLEVAESPHRLASLLHGLGDGHDRLGFRSRFVLRFDSGPLFYAAVAETFAVSLWGRLPCSAGGSTGTEFQSIAPARFENWVR